MGPPHRRRPAVQVPAHGPLLAGGLGVEVHQQQVIASPADKVVGRLEGAVQVGVQVHPAHDVQHAQPQPLTGIDPKAPAGHPAGIVGGAEDALLLVQIGADLDAVPGVVAQGDDIGPGLQDAPGLGGGDAHAGGVLSVDHGKVDPQLFPQ